MHPDNICSQFSKLTLNNGLEQATFIRGEKVSLPSLITQVSPTFKDSNSYNTNGSTTHTTENTNYPTQQGHVHNNNNNNNNNNNILSNYNALDEDIIDFNLCDSDDDEYIQQYMTYQRFAVFDMGPEFNQHYIPHTNHQIQSTRYWDDNEVSFQLRRIDRRLQLFVCDPSRTEYLLPEMPLYSRRQVQGLCTMYKIKIGQVAQTEEGDGKMASLLRKGPKTHLPLDRQPIERYISKSRTPDKARRRMERRPGGEASHALNTAKKQQRQQKQPTATHPRKKSNPILGAQAPPLSGNNIGHRMLENMGWKQGDALGVNKDGIADPIQPVIRSNRRGLGA